MKILTKAEHEKDIMSLGEVKEIIESIEAINLECDDKTVDTLKLGTNVQSALENLLNYIYTLDTKVTSVANSIKNYEGGLGITVTDNTISHSNNLMFDGTIGSGEAQKPDFGGSATLGWCRYDLQGHITFSGTGSITIPSADTTLTSTSVRPISSKAVYDNLIASKIKVTERSIGSDDTSVTIKDDVKTSLESLQNHIYHLYTNDESLGTSLTDVKNIVDKMNISVGSTTVPIYFKNGVPSTCKYTLGSICTKDTTDYLSSEGGTVTGLITASGDVQVPSSKSTVGNSVPLGGSISGLTALTGLSSYRSLIGSVSVSSTWYNIISVRHRNGHNDGGNYGMHIYSATTSTGDLKWNKQTASSTWQGERTILDSSNYTTYCTPANIGASASGHTHSVVTTSANGFMSSTDKSKLDGIATGANKTVVDSSFSTTSTNPVQNKVVKNKIDAMDNVISTLSNSLQSAFNKFSEYLPLTGGTLSDDAVIKAVYSTDKRYTTYGHNIKMYAPNAGWSSGINYYSYSGTLLGVIGGYGTAEALTYFFIGKSYSDYYFKLDTSGNASFKGYVTASGGIITGTLTLSKTQDLSGTANNSPALIVGGTATTAHIEIDCNEIVAKTNGTTPCQLNLNTDGGIVNVGSGGLKTTDGTITASHPDAYKQLVVNRNKTAGTTGLLSSIDYQIGGTSIGKIGLSLTADGVKLHVRNGSNSDFLTVTEAGLIGAKAFTGNAASATTLSSTQPLLFEKEDTSTITSATITGLFTKYKLILIEVYGSKGGRRVYLVPLLILKSRGSMNLDSNVTFNIIYTDDNNIRWFEYQASGCETYTSVRIYAVY